MTYFSLAQLPRSIILQRSLQNGKKLVSGETSFLQIGHFIALRQGSEKDLCGATTLEQLG